MFKRDGQTCLSLEPSVRYYFDKILGREGVMEWHVEANSMLFFGLVLLEDELFGVKYLL